MLNVDINQCNGVLVTFHEDICITYLLMQAVVAQHPAMYFILHQAGGCNILAAFHYSTLGI